MSYLLPKGKGQKLVGKTINMSTMGHGSINQLSNRLSQKTIYADFIECS